ncbi:MAG: adenylate/guanylate cyclase domain-containing protein [Acidimicrobiales bacterium]
MPKASAVEYAPTGDGFVAYRTCGEGPPDVVLVNDWFSHVGELWRPESPFRPVIDRLSGFSRLITFDKRGVGLSDPVQLTQLPTLEEWVDDVQAVLDALEVEQATVIGKGAGGPMAVLFAASHPERVSRIVLVNAWARLAWDDDFPLGVPESAQQRMLAEPYMGVESFRALADEPVTPFLESWWHNYVRTAVSPTTSRTMRKWLFSVDVRRALSAVACPTLVLARSRAWIGAEHARFLADRLPDAQLVMLPGGSDFLFGGDTDGLLAEIEQFITGERPPPRVNRVLATVLYTDLVDSTRRAVQLGDRRWRDLLDTHDRVVREALTAGSGREVKTTGDGFLATFDGPARAVRCAAAVREGVRAIGLEVRSGLHAGEVEFRGDDISGIAAHIGARIGALADPGEILVSRTVRDLVAGSGLEFIDRGIHPLRGVAEDWQLYALAE